jgi:S1-C subfamily serine protease
VVGVGTLLKTRRPPASLRGTGFVVADGLHVVTNSHVLPHPIKMEDKEVLVIFTGAGKKVKYREVEIVSDDPVHDLALLRIKGGKPLNAFLLGDDRSVREGQLVAFTGYPIGAVLGLHPVTHRGIISAITPIAIPVSDTKQLSIAMLKRLKQPYSVFQLDAIAYPGNSGSPVYDPDSGKLLAVVNSVFVKGTKEAAITDPSGISYAIPARHVRNLLKQGKVAFE